ncbi:MAG: DUF1403 family protein, partial [Methylobacterium organophilum]|nr:DUF1403 family protein [Methylobacterium organophilum]
SPDAMAAWRRMPPPVAAADFLVRWTETGCAAAVGGFIGRALVPPLFVRLGATGRPILFPSVGYLGHAWEYRPDRMAREEWAAVGWLDACRRAAERGLLLHGRIVQAHACLHAALKPSRSTGRGAAVADCLTATPAVTGRTVATWTGLSDVASRDLLHRALQAGVLHELTGRAAFRVYGALP